MQNVKQGSHRQARARQSRERERMILQGQKRNGCDWWPSDVTIGIL
jgi:hypothetical protein